MGAAPLALLQFGVVLSTITLRPGKRRRMPLDSIVKTETQIGIHKVTFETNFRMSSPDMNIIWEPGKPEGAEQLPQFQRRFERTRLQHLQKCADITQRTVTVLTTASLRELKEKVENPKGEDDAG